MKVEKIVVETEELEITGATLLSVEEAEKLPKRYRKYPYLWWLRSPGTSRDSATDVYRDGSISILGNEVSNEDAVRPALKIENLESSNLKIGDVFVFGEKRFGIIDDNIALCLEDIGTCAFRNGWRAKDANDYEKSDVKKFVDDWFKEATK